MTSRPEKNNSGKRKKTTTRKNSHQPPEETADAVVENPSAEETELVGDFELDAELHQAASETYVGQWNELVSTTNWEKGALILKWRENLIAQDAPATQYSDEAWSRLVGGVTAQHVGRLRRVFQRFGDSRKDYPGLYWSHFHAAIDWNDPELWLEGAIQNNWSVSQMRKQRWETMGKLPEENPENYQVISAELDEDFEPAVNREPRENGDVATGPLPEGPDFGNDENLSASKTDDAGSKIYADDNSEAVEFVRPFENIGELPDDLMEAFDAFKLAILHHKAEGWQQIPKDDVLACLDSLKELVNAPSADDSAF